MAVPSSRQGLIDYCKRKLGHPVLEINVADEQIDDLVDDAFQFFHERHYDGVEKMYLKYKIEQSFVDRIKARGGNQSAGITTTYGTSNITGIGTTIFAFEETQNFIQVPDTVIGIEKIWKIDNRAISTNLFSVNYQLFLNEIYWFTSTELLNYTMTKRYLEDIDFILHPDKQIRFNKRQNRLYLDTDYASIMPDDYLIIECYRILDPNDFTKVYNDSFVKPYLTALIKKQWGQNMMKFRGAKLPGGIELNGRELYEDALKEIDQLKERMTYDYEIPVLDLIG
jgi:hypothetical protein